MHSVLMLIQMKTDKFRQRARSLHHNEQSGIEFDIVFDVFECFLALAINVFLINHLIITEEQRRTIQRKIVNNELKMYVHLCEEKRIPSQVCESTVCVRASSQSCFTQTIKHRLMD